MPVIYRRASNLPRGVAGRNKALDWVLQRYLDTLSRKEEGEEKKGVYGVLYFADDDNTYDLRLFEQVALFQSSMTN